MAIRLGDEAPDFTAETTEGTIDFHDWKKGSWAVLFSHPKDFTPVCTTELGTVARLKPEFDKRNTKVIGLSVDPIDSHQGGPTTSRRRRAPQLNFPLIADPDRKVADLYDMIHPNANDTLTVRSVFIIGPDNKVKLTLTYPASTGRNFDELLRVIDSLQLTAKHKVATPANWKDGDDVIIGSAVSATRTRRQLFPDGWKAPKPYLRYVPQPGRALTRRQARPLERSVASANSARHPTGSTPHLGPATVRLGFDRGTGGITDRHERTIASASSRGRLRRARHRWSRATPPRRSKIGRGSGEVSPSASWP